MIVFDKYHKYQVLVGVYEELPIVGGEIGLWRQFVQDRQVRLESRISDLECRIRELGLVFN